jgi:hypothetical protein
MTVQSQTSSINYDGPGSVFAIPFRFLANTDIRIIKTPAGGGAPVTLVLTTDYAIIGARQQSGGQATLVLGLIAGDKILIDRGNLPLTQLIDYRANDSFPEESAEDGLDRLTMAAQQLSDRLDKTFSLPPSVSGVSAILPVPQPLLPLVWNAAATALENGSTSLTGDMLLRSNLADSVNPAAGAALVARAVTTNTVQTITGEKLFSYVPTVNGPRLEIQKTNTPANYAGTRANFVLQHKDDEDLGSNQGTAGAYALFTSTGDGVVNAGAFLSESIWQGFVIGSEKYGDGSQHSVSAIGQLQAYGPGGYNELGLVVGNGTNVGSMNGNVTGCELLLKDGFGPGVSGTDNFPTRMFGMISRIARWNSNAYPVHSFYASSEGTVALSSVLAINSGGSRLWEVGIDFRNALFSSDHALIMPNQKFISALDNVGTLRRILGTNAANVNLLFANATSGYFQLATTGGVTLIEANHTLDGANPILLYVGGVLRRVSMGAADSAAPGYRLLAVPN